MQKPPGRPAFDILDGFLLVHVQQRQLMNCKPYDVEQFDKATSLLNELHQQLYQPGPNEVPRHIMVSLGITIYTWFNHQLEKNLLRIPARKRGAELT